LGKAVLKDMDVRPADAAVMHFDPGLAFLRAGRGNVLDLDGSLSSEHRSFHLPLHLRKI
jgi:hypothetical protein